MATTWINYKENKGFWIHESFMQLAYHFIFEELIKPQYVIPNKDEMLYKIKFHIDGWSSGSMSLGWYKFVESAKEIETMIALLENVKSTLEKKGEKISVKELQLIPTEDTDFKSLYSKEPFPTKELIKITDALVQMLNGSWVSENYEMRIEYL